MTKKDGMAIYAKREHRGSHDDFRFSLSDHISFAEDSLSIPIFMKTPSVVALRVYFRIAGFRACGRLLFVRAMGGRTLQLVRVL